MKIEYLHISISTKFFSNKDNIKIITLITA